MDWRDVVYLIGQGLLWLGIIGVAWLVAWFLGYLKR